MSLEFSRKLQCNYTRSAMSVIENWLRRDPDEPVAARRLDSGFMVYPGPGVTWGGCNGLGLDGPVDDSLFEAIDAFFEPRSHSPFIIASAYVDPSLLAGLDRHGYRAWMFRVALSRPATALNPCVPDGIEIREGVGAGVIGRGFNDGAEPNPGFARVERMFDAAPHAHTLIAYRDGVPVGGGRLTVDEGMGLLYGASVLPEARRQGVQGALLRARMNLARTLGCDVVVAETTPGGATERNARRLGFTPALTQVVFRRPGV